MLELRLILIEPGHPDRTAAYRFSDKQLAEMVPVPRNPLAQAMATEAQKRNDPKAHIVAAATLLGKNIADFYDDRHGRNGERRAELIKDNGL
jgi:hypothetical protein